MTDGRPKPTNVEFERLYAQYLPSMIAFFRRQGYRLEEARDLAQDTFVRAFNGFSGFRGDAAFGTWLSRIAANVWRNELRARGAQKRDARHVSIDEAEGLPASALAGDGKDGPYDAAWAQQRHDLVYEAIEKLPPQTQRCLRLRLVQNLKYREIAQLMRISVGTVKSTIHEARAMLKSRLG